MKILLIGCVESSRRLLRKLIEGGKHIVGIITKEDTGFNSDYVDLKPICEKQGIPVLTIENINCSNTEDFIKRSGADIGYCFGWSQLVSEEIISMFPLGMVGFHPAALPYNRGRHPLIWALVLGLTETASTFFKMTAGADEGNIIAQKKIEIAYEDDAATLYDKVMDVAEEQVIEFTDAIKEGRLIEIPQEKDAGSSWRKRSKKDGEIDWRMSSRSIYNLVRGLTHPYVGAHFLHEGEEHKVWKVCELDYKIPDRMEPGKIIAINLDGTMDVKAGEGGIRLLEFDTCQGLMKGDYLP